MAFNPLVSSFVAVPLTTDRHFGGTLKGSADPYISGYHYIYWTTLPFALPNYTKWFSNGAFATPLYIKNFLAGACLSVTPPGGTLNKAEFTGLGGTKWEVPTNIDYGNTITVKFLEFQGTPIFSIFHSWFRMIRDYRTGTSPLTASAESPLSYSKKNYSGSLLYFTTKPDGLNVEYAALYTGVFPTKDPQDSFAGDITAVDKLEIDIEFSLDWIWEEKWVYTEAQAIATMYKAQNGKKHGEMNIDGSVSIPGTDSEIGITPQ